MRFPLVLAAAAGLCVLGHAAVRADAGVLADTAGLANRVQTFLRRTEERIEETQRERQAQPARIDALRKELAQLKLDRAAAAKDASQPEKVRADKVQDIDALIQIKEQELAAANSRVGELERLVNEDSALLEILRRVAPDLDDPSGCRVSPHGHGLLVAFDVPRNVRYGDKQDAETAIMNVVERLIRQGDLSGRVEVVLIEPSAYEPCHVPCTPCAAPAGVAACACR